MSETIAVMVDGKPSTAKPSDSVASAVLNAQGLALRSSISGEPRGPVCGMGICFECRVTIDGVPHQRSCQVPCQPAMRIDTHAITKVDVSEHLLNRPRQQSFEVIVVGGGPAGVAAACVAAEAGRRVAIVDDNPNTGGQIWRRDARKTTNGPASTWLTRLRQQQVDVFPQTQIVGVLSPRTLLADSPSGPMTLIGDRVILASGARERMMPFPGWTLPGVFGAGGLQALVKSGFDLAGRKVVVAGSGPLLLPVAVYLRALGADVRLIAEQTPRGKLARFAGALLWRQPGKLVEALGLGWQMRGIPYRFGCWPIRADGDGRVQAVTLTNGTTTWTEPCDALACGFGLVPNVELANLLGCEITGGFVKVDAHQRTSNQDVFAVGELTGIGGLDKALLEGQIAGDPDHAARHRSERERAMRFVAMLEDAFALRPELNHLADAETIICRCEDVRLGTLKKHSGWRDAKLQTRCGMGPCQGRMCGPIVQQLFGWDNDSTRPPIFPTVMGNLCPS
jgi:NADPH-dependent 2,4-dienoyl-CoA reductase/sulfur reductase-like enzyme